MNVDTVSTSSIYIPPSNGAAAIAPTSTDADDGGAPRAPHGGHHRGGSHLGHAVMDALQSLGLSAPQPAGSDAGTGDASASGTDATSASTGNLRQDLHDLMHALVEAVKDEQTAAGGVANGAADPSHTSSSFASGLTALVSKVSGGNAPSELQAEFTKLASDLQARATDGTAAGHAAAPTLQAFLSKLQDGVGYGTAAGGASSGTIMSSAA